MIFMTQRYPLNNRNVINYDKVSSGAYIRCITLFSFDKKKAIETFLTVLVYTSEAEMKTMKSPRN